MKKNQLKYTLWTHRGTKLDASAGEVVSSVAMIYSMLTDDQKARLQAAMAQEDQAVAEHRAAKGDQHTWGVGGLCTECGGMDLIAPHTCPGQPESEESRS